MTNPFPTLTSLDQVSPATYGQAEAYVMALLAENFPDRDFSYGRALYWHVVVPAAVATAAMEINAGIMGASLSLKWVRDNPESTDEALATALLSNYYQVLGAGAKSVGTLAIVVSENAPYSIAKDTVFTAYGTRYLATSAVFAQTSAAEVQDSTDRLLTPRADGSFQFLVPVESEFVGVATFAPQGTLFTIENPPPNFITVTAASDISGGSNATAVKDIAATLPQAFAAQTFGGRAHIQALIASAFPGTTTAVVGMGDPEQWRDTHNLLQIQTGGMVDLYVTTQSSAGTEIREITATLLDPVAKTWEFVIPRDLAAGIYAVLSVLPPGDTRAPLPVLAQERSISLPLTGYRPLIEVPAETAFSAYQAMTVRFTDTYGDHIGLSAGATRPYDVSVLLMPLIREINDFLVAGGLTKADNVLVRAAVPCLTRISLVVRLLDSDSLTAGEISAMKQAIVNKVAARGFGYGVLSSSIIVDAVHDYLSGRSDVGSNTVTLRGDIYPPSGQVMVLEGSEIRIPEAPWQMVTKNNTVFLTDVSRIDISLVPVETP